MKPPKPKGPAKAALRGVRKRREAETLKRARKVRSLAPTKIRKNQRRTEYF